MFTDLFFFVDIFVTLPSKTLRLDGWWDKAYKHTTKETCTIFISDLLAFLFADWDPYPTAATKEKWITLSTG